MNQQNVLDQLAAAIREGRGNEQVRFRQQLTTYMFSHNMPADIQHKASVHHLDADLDSGKGFFSRSHLITTRGTVRDTFVFWTAALAWMEANA